MLQPIFQPFHDRLSVLLNTYLARLRESKAVTAPSESMSEWAATIETKAPEDLQGVYSLQVLQTSLHSLYYCWQFAATELDTFFSLNGSDFSLYAAQRRLESVRENGYEDVADLSPDGTAYCLRSEPDALAPFQLKALLAEHFASASSATHGERIGSSTSASYAYRHQAVLQATQKQQAAAWSNLDCEVELDHTLSGSALIEQFDEMLAIGKAAAALYDSLGEYDTAGYQRLFHLVNQVVIGREEV